VKRRRERKTKKKKRRRGNEGIPLLNTPIRHIPPMWGGRRKEGKKREEEN